VAAPAHAAAITPPPGPKHPAGRGDVCFSHALRLVSSGPANTQSSQPGLEWGRELIAIQALDASTPDSRWAAASSCRGRWSQSTTPTSEAIISSYLLRPKQQNYRAAHLEALAVRLDGNHLPEPLVSGGSTTPGSSFSSGLNSMALAMIHSSVDLTLNKLPAKKV